MDTKDIFGQFWTLWTLLDSLEIPVQECPNCKKVFQKCPTWKIFEGKFFGTPCTSHSSSSHYASHFGGFDVADDSTEPGNMKKVVYLLEDARLEVRVLYKKH